MTSTAGFLAIACSLRPLFKGWEQRHQRYPVQGLDLGVVERTEREPEPAVLLGESEQLCLGRADGECDGLRVGLALDVLWAAAADGLAGGGVLQYACGGGGRRLRARRGGRDVEV